MDQFVMAPSQEGYADEPALPSSALLAAMPFSYMGMADLLKAYSLEERRALAAQSGVRTIDCN